MKTARQDKQETNDQQLGLAVAVAVIQTTVTDIKTDVGEIKRKLEIDYVTKQEYDPIKRVVYGMVGLMLTGMVGALLALVIEK